MPRNPKRKLLIFYDYFDPAYKAGGPIRSLVNLVKLMEGTFQIFVVSTNKDHDGTKLDVQAERWLDYGKNVKVKYLSDTNRNYRTIKETIAEVNPETVYLNGIYSMLFVVFPLLVVKKRKDIKTVIAPRGMLQSTSLSIKPFKKKVYLGVLKTFIINSNIIWHVTTGQEKVDLHNLFGNEPECRLIGNVPFYNPDCDFPNTMKIGPKVFGTVALISPMKNIHLILAALKEIKSELIYNLYGPVKDDMYWKECQQITGLLPDNIKFNYKGEVSPEKVSEIVSDIDFYIQPSKSENFGHSIFEAFNQGVPVIISDQTPWKNLYAKQAGWDVDLNEPETLRIAIENALDLDEKNYLDFRRGARRIAVEYMQSNDLGNLYKELFDG